MPPTRTAEPGSLWPWLAALSSVAAGLVVVYATSTPNPLGDPAFFHSTGNLIAGGHGYIRPELFAAHHREVATALHPPLYPLLVAAASVLGVTALAPAIVTGALIGLAMLTRSEGTILLIILPIVAWLSRGTRGNRWRLAAALAACAVLVTPWVIRNAALLGRPVLSTNVGTLVASANCGSTYYGAHLGDWRHCYAPLQPGPTAADEARWSFDLTRAA